MSAHELFHAGRLSEAVTAALDAVRQHPTDTGRRLFLAELLCFTGDLERADNHLNAVSEPDPQAVAALVAFRQVVRAEKARQDFFSEGRLPTFLGRPEGAERLLLEASTHARAGSADEAAAVARRAEEQRPHPSGSCDGRPFADFRDLDDRVSCVLEVLTVKGDYYWVPFERIESIEFRSPERPRDLLWRRAHLTVRGGPDSEVFVPVLYPGASAEADDQIRLGRATDWRGEGAGSVLGVGQRMFLVDEEARPILEVQSVVFQESAQIVSGAPEPAAG